MRTQPHRPRLAIACQGGGSHTAFTAGVLAYLFLAFEYFRQQAPDEPHFQLGGLSGTSGGAITAAMAWSDPGNGDWAEGARRVLRYWNRNKANLDPRGKAPWWWGEYFANAAAQWEAGWADWLPRVDVPPSPLLSTLTRERMRADMRAALGLPGNADRFFGRPGLELYVGAVDIVNRASRVQTAFQTFPKNPHEGLLLDELLASACIPDLFEPQILPQHGRPGAKHYFWDGLYSQNPPLNSFFTRRRNHQKPDLVWIIQINPSRYEGKGYPRTPRQVDDRRNELAGNLSLGQELRGIDRINKVAAEVAALARTLPPDTDLKGLASYKPVTVAFIALGSHADSRRPLAAYTLDHASKLDRDPAFIDALIAEGVAVAYHRAAGKHLVKPDPVQDERFAPRYRHAPWPKPAELLPLLADDRLLAWQWAELVEAIGPGLHG